jgi:hypothetical protein
MGTLFLFADILPNYHTRGGKVYHLSTLSPVSRDLTQIRLAMLAGLHRLHDHFIGRGRQPQARTLVANLSSWLFAAFLAQALELTDESIRRGRLMAIVAVFFQPLL